MSVQPLEVLFIQKRPQRLRDPLALKPCNVEKILAAAELKLRRLVLGILAEEPRAV